MWPWGRYWNNCGWGWLSGLRVSPYTWLPEVPSKEEEKAMLQEEAIILALELERVTKRIEKLKKQEVKNA